MSNFQYLLVFGDLIRPIKRALISFALIAGMTANVAAEPGQLDPTFGTAGVVVPIEFASGINAVLRGGLTPLANGSVIVADTCAPADAPSAICLKRLTSVGQIDSTFGLAGVATAAFPVAAPSFPPSTHWSISPPVYVTQQPDGKLLASAICTGAAFYGRLCMARFLSSGILDPSFNSGAANPGTLDQSGLFGYQGGLIALQSNGKIVLGGQCSYPDTFCVTRLNSNGTLDTTFANASTGAARVMPFNPVGGRPRTRAAPTVIAIDTVDRIVIGGVCTDTTFNVSAPCIGRLNPNGSTDVTFVNPDSNAPSYGSWFQFGTYGESAGIEDLAIQSDGKIVVVGPCGNAPATSTCVTRLLETGSPDIAFVNPSGLVPGTVLMSAADGFRASRALKLQPDGKIVFAGECSSIFSLFCVGRLNADGTRDSIFGSSPDYGSGVVQLVVGSGSGYAADIAINARRKIVLYGACRQSSGALVTGCAARLLGGDDRTSACTLNVDANDSITAKTDAMLAARYILGMRGNALVEGVLGANPGRTTQQIEDHLASLNLDVDGDGQTRATTDGLLLIRAMLGLSGNALTAGATNAAHPNVRNSQQILTWIETTHGVACLP